jgi:hypothetical protein
MARCSGVSMNYYYDKRYCPNCKRDTLQQCRDSDHERDSSNDFQECLYCGWERSGYGPYEVRVEKRKEFKYPLTEFAIYLFRTPCNWERICIGNDCASVYNQFVKIQKPKLLLRRYEWTKLDKWPWRITHTEIKELDLDVVFLEEEYSDYCI